MKKLINNYKELKKGIYQLKPLNNKGEYANINTNTGIIIYYKKVTNMPMPASKITIKELEKKLNKNNAKWLLKDYKAWRQKYPEVYNNMIDKINQEDILQ
ncbi:hypothetical protein [Clostridium sporogenes]|uniref:hypothetical protein n=1 Tax=Clostridium sporogenes TaxID=1509 RepID=UPI0013D8583F|nr:hypothetical protein [Clostridium sporogenes]NFH40735.1 hypothetical protein [Clostridium sporogenes]